MAAIHQRAHYHSNNHWQQSDHSARTWDVCDIPIEEDEEDEEIQPFPIISSVGVQQQGDDDDDDDDDDVDGSSSMSSSPSIPDENINFDLVYALHTFVATVEGQASVVKGDALILMEDTNIYWWLVEVLKTREVGYIPAENIETPYERLARLNKHRNVEITSPSHESNHIDGQVPLQKKKKLKGVTIASDEATRVIYYEVVSDLDEEEDEDPQEADDDDDDEFQDAQEIALDDVNDDEADDDGRLGDVSTVPPNALASTAGSADMTTMANEPVEPLRVFAGNIGQDAPLFHTFSIQLSTTAEELVKEAMARFAVDRHKHPMAADGTLIEYYISVQGQDGDDYVLAPQDKPLSIFKSLTAPLTTPMPSVSHIKQSPPTPEPAPTSVPTMTMTPPPSTSRRRPRSSSFSNYEQTSYDEDSVIRFYLHRRIKRAHEREGIFYIKVSLYPDDGATTAHDNIAAAATSVISPSGKKKKLHAPRQEIDRIDKIMAVKLEQQIGSVIAMALEKFHVPDAEPDYAQQQMLGPTDRCLTKYCMSVRCTSSSTETPLDPRDHMATALHHQSKTASPVVTSDLLFILRRADAPIHRRFQKQKQQEQQGNTGSGGKSSSSNNDNRRVHPAPILSPIDPNHRHHHRQQENAERRPSILDILMDSPRSTDKPGFLNSPTTTFDDCNSILSISSSSRRPSFPSSLASQERKSSLTPSYHPGTPTSATVPGVGSGDFVAPHSPSTSSLSPPAPGFRRTSVMSTSASSSVFSDYCDTTTTSTSITTPDMSHRTSISVSPQSSSGKKENSLKQQLKRLVGWGGSSSSNSSNGGSKSKKSIAQQPQPQQEQEQQQPHHQVAANGGGDGPKVSLGQQNNDSTLSVKYKTTATATATATATVASSSQVSIVSSPPTPLTPTPQHAKGNSQRDSMAQLHSKPPTPVNSNTPFSPIQGSPVPSSSQVLLPNESAVSSSATSLSSVDDKEPVGDLSDDSEDSDSDDDGDEEEGDGTAAATATAVVEEEEEKTQAMGPADADRNKELPSKPQQHNGGEMTDIQTQYTRWIDSQEQDHTKRATTTPCDYSESPLPPLPMAMASSSTSALPSTPSTYSAALHPHGMVNTGATTLSMPPPPSPSPSPANRSSKEAGIDDLFFLVTRGVDYLQSRESSKWDDEGGYEFHPWNRPDGSFVIRKKPETATPPPAVHDIVFDETHTSSNDPLAPGGTSDGDIVTAAAAATAVALADGNSSISLPPVRSNSTSSSQQQQQQQKSGVVVPSSSSTSSKPGSIRQSPPAAQNEACIDEQELQRIVAAHIVF